MSHKYHQHHVIGDPNIEVAINLISRGVIMGKGGKFKKKKSKKWYCETNSGLTIEDFDDDESIKEYAIAQMCQNCQGKFYHGPNFDESWQYSSEHKGKSMYRMLMSTKGETKIDEKPLHPHYVEFGKYFITPRPGEGNTENEYCRVRRKAIAKMGCIFARY